MTTYKEMNDAFERTKAILEDLNAGLKALMAGHPSDEAALVRFRDEVAQIGKEREALDATVIDRETQRSAKARQSFNQSVALTIPENKNFMALEGQLAHLCQRLIGHLQENICPALGRRIERQVRDIDMVDFPSIAGYKAAQAQGEKDVQMLKAFGQHLSDIQVPHAPHAVNLYLEGIAALVNKYRERTLLSVPTVVPRQTYGAMAALIENLKLQWKAFMQAGEGFTGAFADEKAEMATQLQKLDEMLQVIAVRGKEEFQAPIKALRAEHARFRAELKETPAPKKADESDENWLNMQLLIAKMQRIDIKIEDLRGRAFILESVALNAAEAERLQVCLEAIGSVFQEAERIFAKESEKNVSAEHVSVSAQARSIGVQTDSASAVHADTQTDDTQTDDTERDTRRDAVRYTD